ncbi:MAG: hypothetical protein GOMPHAMPRED_002893 [Gomphillus americanus]|uniref:Uncharacterized protein n=1 Tax=Gomphillus americanus TaxID=1940652 RepID=A0A8H3EG53_9LECA|nr:MAG: hypothetical protein GOMPHAMPRED_002893 [Gomphillus americanus]
MAQGGAHYREDCKTAMIRYEQRGNSDAYFRWRENILNLAESKRSYQHGPMDEQGRNLYLFSAYRDWVGAEFDDAVAVEAESKQQFDITNRWQHDQQIIVSLGEPVSYLEKLAEDAKKDVPSSRSKIIPPTITMAKGSY